MQFNTLLFILVFLPLFIFCVLFVKNNKARNVITLLFSFSFYLLNDSKYFILLLLVILVSYFFAEVVKKNVILYVLYLIITLSLLSFFKFGTYVFTSLKELNILMPLGISYYLFMSISYVSDCYYSKYEYSKNIIKVASYISFFPCISCGPLIRFNDFSLYFDNTKTIRISTIDEGFKRFIMGLAKKVIIADQVGILANVAFDKTTILTTPLAWAGVIAAGFQIYYDFSGYSDMAIGIGQMIGFQMTENFNYPFISRSWSEFWRRWHISLGSWFRDYVYIPLGGNRVNKSRFILNIMAVWALTGIWHGSTLNYLFWGLTIGLIVLFEKLFKIKFNNFVGIVIVDILFLCAVVMFKCINLDTMLFYFKNMFTWTGINFSYYKLLDILYLWPFIISGAVFSVPKTLKLIKKNTAVFNIFVIICLVISIIYIVGGTQQTFVYFAF